MSEDARSPLDLGLPHRPPFLFVDKIVELEPGLSAHGQLTLWSDNPIFAGHFPGHPLVPGVILTEALAQIAGIAGASGAPDHPPRFLLTAIRNMKFFFAIPPEKVIDLRAKLSGTVGDLWSFAVSAEMEGRCAAAGTIILSVEGDAHGPRS